MMEIIKNCMNTNLTLAKYDLKHNEIGDAQIDQLTEILSTTAKHVQMIMLSQWLQSEAYNRLQEAMAANKPAKGKKGKKK